MQSAVLPLFLFTVCVIGLAVILLVVANIFNPIRPGSVKRMPYESGMDPFHDTRRPVDVRFHLLAIAFLVFDVELLFLYPWAVAVRPGPVEPSASVPGAPLGIDAAFSAGFLETRGLAFAGNPALPA